MADAIGGLLCDEVRAGKMAAAARQAVLERFTIETPVEESPGAIAGIPRRTKPPGKGAE